MGKDLRTTYLGNKNSTERLKRGIASARILVKDCQMECDRNTKQQVLMKSFKFNSFNKLI